MNATLHRASCAIAVMGKVSVPGYTKTRLYPLLSYEEAAELNTCFIKDMVANVASIVEPSAVSPYVAYGPAGGEAFFRAHIPQAGLIEACASNFGDCLLHTIEDLFSRGHEAVAVLNSDSPTLPTAYLRESVRLLTAADDRVVMGPSTDGGYYFLGMKRPHRRLFEGIDWSTARVAQQTRQRCWESGLTLCLLEPWYDVDDAPALRLLHGELMLDRRPPWPHDAQSFLASHTRAAVSRLMREANLSTRLDDAPFDSHATIVA